MFQASDRRERFLGMVPEPVLRKLGEAIVRASLEAVSLCKTTYKRFPSEDPVGIQRYYKVQDNLANALEDLKKLFPLSSIEINQHEGTSSHYVVFTAPQLRLSFIKVRAKHRNPTPRQRLTSRPSQPTLFDDKNILSATLVYGYEKGNPSTVEFMFVRFLDESMNYGTDQVDLLEILSKPASAAHVEKVSERPAITLRPGVSLRKPKSKPQQPGAGA